MEIGSEFHLEIANQIHYSNYFEDGDLYGYARGVLNQLVNQLAKLGVKRFLVPNYLCESVLTPFLNNEIKVEYYCINSDLTINEKDFSDKFSNCQAVYVINYFNINNEHFIRERFDLSNVLTIIDVTHNFFNTDKSESDIYIASLRKWLSVPSGAYLKLNKPLDFEVTMVNNLKIKEAIYKRFYAASLKQRYLVNNEEILKVNFLNLFNDSEQLLDEYGYDTVSIDVLSKSILNTTDWQQIFKRRQENFHYLDRNLKDLHEITYLCENENEQVPIGFPIFTPRRDELRTYLISNKVYCPVHWPIPEKMSLKNEIVENINAHILTLPCDQRYSIEDMGRMVALIRDFYRG